MPEPFEIGTLSPQEFQEVRRVFEAALERPASERDAYVERACAGNAVLHAEVDRMLAAERRPHQLIDGGAGRNATVRDNPLPSVCPSCGAVLAASSRFCPACGTPVAADGFEGRFRAGAPFANRFRIVAALGRGGMGEVYRAHDLELGEPVALKFLTALRTDERARARLRNEVRLARQLSHTNVCRVYDIGEAHGELYLSMEYVDGEDLGALLKRIGRLPVDKGVEIARKLCVGLAAAHAKCVLHRDFKPANIMIDGAGEVRIMDFGLATIAAELDAKDVRSGTPAYMAPEQLAGRKATVQSDLYALGLVLYELFTGKAAFTGTGIEELQRQRDSHPSTAPSTLIPDLGPRVERAILRCLEPDPKRRPASALEVSAFLPGGDPLAEALAAGETPSPEMVAAAGSTEGLRPAVAMALLACIAIGLAAWCWLTPTTQIVSQLPLELPPEALAAKGRELAAALGYPDRPADIAYGFRNETGYLEFVEKTQSGSPAQRRQRWRALLGDSPSPVSFWYRESTAPLSPSNGVGTVTATDPQPGAPGNLSLALGLDGSLLAFDASPTRAIGTREAGSTINDWTVPFKAARLDQARLLPVEPVSGQDANHREWTGTYPRLGAFPIRVTAASALGKITSFEIAFPWSAPRPADAPLAGPLSGSLFAGLLVVAVVVARYNWRAGRADHNGAWRIGVLCAVVTLLAIMLVRHDAASLFSGGREGVGLTIATGTMAAAFYLAFEPWVRRLWPQAMITWSRVVAGRWRDPLVGRDVLFAVTAAVAVSCLHRVMFLWLVHAGGPPAATAPIGGGFGFALDNLTGARQSIGGMLASVIIGLQSALTGFFSLFVFRVLLKKSWLAITAVVILNGILLVGSDMTGFLAWQGQNLLARANLANAVSLFLLSLLLTVLAIRLGFFAMAVWVCVGQFVEHAMLTPDFGAWYGQSSLLAVVVVSAVALWAFYTSLGERPVLGTGLERGL